MRLVKNCPSCGHANDPSELWCQATLQDGRPCDYSLFEVESSLPGRHPATAVVAPTPPVRSVPEPALDSAAPSARGCVNGHRLQPGDAVCLECGADAAPEAETDGAAVAAGALPAVPGWEVVGSVPDAPPDEPRFLVRAVGTPSAPSVAGIIHWHPRGRALDAMVYQRLRSMQSPYCVQLLDFGQTADWAFEVWAAMDGRDFLEVSPTERRAHGMLRIFVGHIADALHALESARLSLGGFSPRQIRVSGTAEHPHFTLSDLGSLTVATLDLQAWPGVPPNGRYTPPERLIGLVATASDWWSLGVILLECLTEGQVFNGIHEKAWNLQVITEGAVIPEYLPPAWRSLLMGLLTADHTMRWRLDQVRRWLEGEVDVPHGYKRPQSADEAVSELALGATRHRSASRYALSAATEEHWDEASLHLADGRLLTWLEDGRLSPERLAEARRLAADEALQADERLMLVLVFLNENLPLCHRGQIIARDTLPAHAALASAWLRGPLPARLERIGRHQWLADLARRRQSAFDQARERRVTLEDVRFESAALIADRSCLERAWRQRRSQWPDAAHSAIVHLLSKGSLADAELVLLIGAKTDQFVPAREILEEAESEAAFAEVSHLWDPEAARLHLDLSRKDIHQAIADRLVDFSRSGLPLIDEWADTFRYEHRLSLPRCLVLLSIPRDSWQRPEGGDHWRLLMRFFQRRVLAGIQRGPLLALTVTGNSQRIDLTELGTGALPASTLLDHLVSRQPSLRGVDPAALAQDPRLSSRLRRLAHTVEGYRRETGISGLNLGFPLLLRRDAGGATERKAKTAPIFLWPVRLVLPEGGAQVPRLAFDVERQEDGESLRLNPALDGLLSHEEKLRLDEAMIELRHRSSLTAAQVMEMMATVFSEAENELVPLAAAPSLAPGSRHRVLYSAAIFLCNFASQTLAYELRQLEHRACLHGPLTTLLRLPTIDSQVESTPQATPSSPTDLHLVTQADPSQKRAAWAARHGTGVLVQGPPGTGKSQTIVNIVADALCRGERVLVVCQKQAALDVVRTRMEGAGLGNRLALITDAARDRRGFLQILRAQLDSLRLADDYASLAEQRNVLAAHVSRMEEELDSLHQAMTRPVLGSGLTYQRVLEQLISAGDTSALRVPALRPHLLPLHHETVRSSAVRLSEVFLLYLRARPQGSPLHVLKPFSTDPDNLAALSDALKGLAASETQRMIDPSANSKCLEPGDHAAVSAWLEENRTPLLAISEPQARLVAAWLPILQTDLAQSLRARAERIAATARALQEPPSTIGWHQKLSHLTDAEISRMSKAAATWIQWRPSAFRMIRPRYWQAKFILKKHVPGVAASSGDDVHHLLAFLTHECVVRPLCRELESIRSQLGLPQGPTNLRASELAGQAATLAADIASARSVWARGGTCPHAPAYVHALQAGHAAAMHEFVVSTQHGLDRWALRRESLNRLAALEPWIEEAWCAKLAADVQNGLDTRAWQSELLAAWPTLADFQRFRLRACSLLPMENELLPILADKRSEWEAMSAEQVAPAVQATISREALIAWRVEAERLAPALLLDRDEFQTKVRHLATEDDRLLMVTRRQAAAIAHAERVAPRARWDDVVMLTGPRARRLREVIDMGDSRGLFDLRPVWLATPDTIAKLFPLREALFDLVIFDEASQLPVEHALPALYRSRRVVVSGDEKQLPPTRFFSGTFDDDDEENGSSEAGADEIEETNRHHRHRREVKDCSDLLELAAAVLPSEALNIHYRSRYRPLINHSNAAFYENRLSVPALHPDDEIRRVDPLRVIPVNGTYMNQSNPDEASAVVEFLTTLWSESPAPPTLGVVTFNLKQAELIEEMLDRRAEADPAFQALLHRETSRHHNGEDCGFFVKNLENVQGDERDWMVFSTTFGPDREGRFVRNFGAVIQRGGERRLNVATTRAKEKMVIFTSMPIQQISDLTRRSRAPDSPRDFLQTYLLYAEAVSAGRFDDARRWLDIMPGDPQNARAAGTRERRAFAEQVAAFLQRLGHEVEFAPADDAFGFDLAIRHPRTGLFALAIECDSPRHPDLERARDREVWRPAVLRASVPVIHRVWSRLWLAEESHEKVRLKQAVDQALA